MRTCFENWLTAFTVKHSHRRHLSRRTPVAAGLESLEDRTLLAGTATAHRARSDIFNIAADADPNFIRGNVLTNDILNSGSRLKVTAIFNSAAVKRSVPSGAVGTEIAGQFGRLRILANGRILYRMKQNSTAIARLAAGEKLIDTFTYNVKNNQPGFS